MTDKFYIMLILLFELHRYIDKELILKVINSCLKLLKLRYTQSLKYITLFYLCYYTQKLLIKKPQKLITLINNLSE